MDTVRLVPSKPGEPSKSYRRPSIFLHLSSGYDGNIIRTVNDDFSSDNDDLGIQHLDGFFVYMKDHAKVHRGMTEYSTLTAARALENRVLMIDPAFDLLIRGSQSVRKQMMKLGFFDNSVARLMDEIAISNGTTGQKTDRIIKEVYPEINATCIFRALEYQLKNRAVTIIFPSVPLTSSRKLDEQVKKVKQLFGYGRQLLENALDRHEAGNGKDANVDTMNLLTVNVSLLKKDNFAKLFEVLLHGRPSQVALRFVYLHEDDAMQVRAVLRTVRELHENMQA